MKEKAPSREEWAEKFLWFHRNALIDQEREREIRKYESERGERVETAGRGWTRVDANPNAGADILEYS